MANVSLYRVLKVSANTTAQLQNVLDNTIVKTTIKKQEECIPGSLVLVKGHNYIVPYEKRYKYLFQAYHDTQLFKGLVEPEKFDNYTAYIQNQNITYVEFYKQVLTDVLVDLVLKEKLYKKYVKTTSCVFKVDLGLYYKPVIEKLCMIQDRGICTIRYLDTNRFYCSYTYNALLDRPFLQFQQIFNGVTEIDFATIEFK